jgi:hypothetical protein
MPFSPGAYSLIPKIITKLKDQGSYPHYDNSELVTFLLQLGFYKVIMNN